MADAAKFLFDTVFQSPDEQPKKPLVYSEEDMQALKEAAFEAGRESGFQEALLGQEREALDEVVDTLSSRQQSLEEQTHQSVTQMILHIFHNLFPVYAQRSGFDEVKQLIEAAFASHESMKLTLTLHPDCVPYFQVFQQGLQEKGFANEVQCLTDPAMALSDVRVDWQGGGMERRTERLQEEVEIALTRLGATLLPETAAPDATPPNNQEETSDE